MSVVVPILGDSVDAVVRGSEELESVVAAVDSGLWDNVQVADQNAARCMDGLECGCDIGGQKAKCYAALAVTPWTIVRAWTVYLEQRAVWSDKNGEVRLIDDETHAECVDGKVANAFEVRGVYVYRAPLHLLGSRWSGGCLRGCGCFEKGR